MTFSAWWQTWRIAVVITAIFLTVAYLITHRVTPTPLPVKTQELQDSLHATQPADTRERDSLNSVVAVARRRSLAASRAADSSGHAAHTLALAADSLAVVARRADSSHVADSLRAEDWHTAYTARTAEADTLRVVIRADSSAIAFLRLTASADSTRASAADQRRVALQRLNDDLGKQLAHSAPVCTVPLTFGKVGCPSRTMVAVLSVLAGAATFEGARMAITGKP